MGTTMGTTNDGLQATEGQVGVEGLWYPCDTLPTGEFAQEFWQTPGLTALSTITYVKVMNMHEQTGLPPQPTSTLKQFDVLVGKWKTVGTHPAFPSAVHGLSSFEWLREGTLLTWHFDWEHGGPPSALSVIGHDDVDETCSMLYSDVRGVARIYQMRLEGGVWRMWRDSPGFSQRMTGTISSDGNTITCRGELSRDGSIWEQDLDVTYTRIS